MINIIYSDKYCEWKFTYEDKNKQVVTTNCNNRFIMTKTNKYYRTYKQVIQPNSTTKCPFCDKEIDIRCYD